MKQIHKNIQRLRELKNITRKEMSARLGISGSGYSKMERGDIDLNISRLLEIAKILNVDIKQILDFDTEQIFVKPEPGRVAMNDHREKYIKMLEDEVERLKEELKGRKKKN